MNSVGLTATPRGVVTLIFPDPASAGTRNVIVVCVAASTSAGTLFNRTWVVFVTGSKFAPTMVARLPAALTVGSTTEMDGPSPTAVTTNVSLLVTLAAATSTLTAPADADAGPTA